jgi:mono/diheme cytochrome c family protein
LPIRTTTWNAKAAKAAKKFLLAVESVRKRLFAGLAGFAFLFQARARFVFAGFAGFAFLFGSGCRQDMHDQPKYTPLRGSTFFTDARSARSPVEGTVARGLLRDDELLYTGKLNGVDAAVFPFRVDAQVMARGQERFNIYCAPCHSRTGQGDGMVVLRGYRRPPSFHQDRLRETPVGHFFDVITNGFGAMPDYAAQIKAADRWAIVAYIRALQLSEHATLADVPSSERTRIQ